MELNVNEICDQLQSEERQDVRRALSKVLDAVKDVQQNKSPENLGKVKEWYESLYLFLLKCYSNRFENIRENAVLLVNEFFEVLPRNDFYLQGVVSTLAARIGKQEIIESSEEMRLLLIQQLHGLIQKFKMDEESDVDLLDSSLADIVAILLKTLTDPYPAVSKEACFCLVTFSEGTKGIYNVADKFPPLLYKLIHHKHSHNRVAATKALGQVAMFILSNNHDCLLRIFHEMSPLLMDSMPLVRLECGLVGCKMLLKHRDRYSYFERMIPLVLCCLKDDSPEIPKTIDKLWKECGQLYFEENETELSKAEIADFTPKNYPPNVIRPTLGCRAIVQRCLRIIPLIMRESSDWKDNVRLHSLKLFYQFVLHAERTLTAKFFEFLPDLAKACADEEKEIREEAVKVCNLLGHLLTFGDWIEHGIGALEKNCRLGYLVCFHEIYKTSEPENEEFNHALEVSKIIANDDFCHKTNKKFQTALLELVSNILQKSSTIEERFQSLSLDSSNLTFNLYKVTIKVMSLSYENEDKALQTQGQEILEALKNEKSLSELHNEYLGNILTDLLPLLETPELDMGTEPILLLNGFIRICHFQENYLRAFTKCILNVWEFSASDAKVKIFTSIAAAMMNWDKTMGTGQNSKLENFLNKCVLSHLPWKAGASAESTRSLAKKFQTALLQLVSNILQKSSTIEERFQSLSLDSSNLTFNLYKVTIKVMSLSYENEDKALQTQGQEILKALKNEKSLSELHNEYLGNILTDLLPLLETPELDMGTEPILLLNGFIRICHFQENYLRAFTKCILNVWEFSASDAKVKIFTSIAAAMINWDKAMGTGQNSKLEKFLNKCVSSHLPWKAGASAESTRSLAVTTLCAAVQGASSVSKGILPKFAKFFPSLIEDQCIATRLYSLKCFTNFGPVEMELLKPIAYAILQRLDDQSSEIRYWAVKVIPLLEAKDPTDDEKQIFESFVSRAVSMLFLHLDGPEVRIKDPIKNSLTLLNEKWPSTFKKCFDHSMLTKESCEIKKFQTALLELVSNILQKSSTIEERFQSLSLDSSNLTFNLYKVTIKVMSLSYENEDKALQTQGQEILEALKNEKSLSELHNEYLGNILTDLLPLLETPELDMGTEPILLLNGFIRICHFQENYLRAFTKCILNVWEFSASDAKVKIFTSIAAAMMNWDKTMGTGQNSKLEKFLNKCVLSHLPWKAGASAESTRSLAVTTLCAAVQGASSVSKGILPKFAKFFPSLIEDQCIATRLYSLKCFTNFGPVEMELLKPIAYAILQRLDDQSSEIRYWAVKVIPLLEAKDPTDDEKQIFESFVSRAVSMLFLHLDGPEVRIKDPIKNSLTLLNEKWPSTFKKCFDHSMLTKESSEIVRNIFLA